MATFIKLMSFKVQQIHLQTDSAPKNIQPIDALNTFS